MEMKGLMGGFYRISEWIMRFSMTNLLWIVTSIPIFFIGLVLFSSEDVEVDLAVVQTALLLMAIIAPFTIFPSTSAMFSLVRKWHIGEEDAPILRTFFGSYKRNYVQSMLGGIIYMALIIVMYVNYRFYIQQENFMQVLSVLFIMLFIITIISMFNYFCVLSHLHMKTFSLIKNAVLITIGRPFTSLLIVITNAVLVYLCFTYFNMFLVFFFMGSGVAYMTFFHFNRMFQKIQDKQEAFEAEQLQEQGEHAVDSDFDATIDENLDSDFHASIDVDTDKDTEVTK